MMLHDLCYSIGSLRRAPLFTAAAAVSLVVGITTCTMVRNYPSGLYEATLSGADPHFVELTLNADGTFGREKFVICDTAPCPPISETGRYRFTRRILARYIEFTDADGRLLDRYRYRLEGDTLTLRGDRHSRAFTMVPVHGAVVSEEPQRDSAGSPVIETSARPSVGATAWAYRGVESGRARSAVYRSASARRPDRS